MRPEDHRMEIAIPLRFFCVHRRVLGRADFLPNGGSPVAFALAVVARRRPVRRQIQRNLRSIRGLSETLNGPEPLNYFCTPPPPNANAISEIDVM